MTPDPEEVGCDDCPCDDDTCPCDDDCPCDDQSPEAQ